MKSVPEVDSSSQMANTAPAIHRVALPQGVLLRHVGMNICKPFLTRARNELQLEVRWFTARAPPA